jgi:hypothetical protein
LLADGSALKWTDVDLKRQEVVTYIPEAVARRRRKATRDSKYRRGSFWDDERIMTAATSFWEDRGAFREARRCILTKTTREATQVEHIAVAFFRNHPIFRPGSRVVVDQSLWSIPLVVSQGHESVESKFRPGSRLLQRFWDEKGPEVTLTAEVPADQVCCWTDASFVEEARTPLVARVSTSP